MISWLALAFGLLIVPGGGLAHAVRATTGQCWLDKGALVVAAAFGDIAGDFILDAATPHSLLHLTRAQSAGIVTDTATGPLALAGRRLPGFVMSVADIDGRTRRAARPSGCGRWDWATGFLNTVRPRSPAARRRPRLARRFGRNGACASIWRAVGWI